MNQSWLEDQVLPDPVPGRPLLTLARRCAYIACLLALIAFAMRDARADEVRAPDGSVVYVRHDTPCDDADINAHLLRLGAGSRIAEFKKGTLTYGGKDWRSCWIEVDEMVYSVDEEGAPLQALPARLFKPKYGA